MRIIIFIGILSFMVACTDNGSGNHEGYESHDSTAVQAKDTSKKSLPAQAHATVNGAEISIKYHAPAVRGRTIWGGLVSYDAVWVTGAHSATTLEVNKDFIIAGKTIPAGKYALFTIPSKEQWTIILNRNWDQHLADEYSETEDVVRVTAIPEATEAITERLTYSIGSTNKTTAWIMISWEKLRVPFQIEVR